jgi:hypothetical protein
MTTLKKFIVSHLFWTAAIASLVIPISMTTADGLTAAQYLRWIAHSAALACFPAGLMIGAETFRGRVWRNIGLLSAAEIAIMLVVFVLLGFAAPMDGRNIITVFEQIRVATEASWLQRNQQSWVVYMTLAEVLSVPIYAGLGMMLGAWAEQVLPATFRRILFWAMSLKLVAFTYLITENSYEMLVIKTNGPAAFSAFFMLLIPLGMYGGLILPSIALAKRARVQ